MYIDSSGSRDCIIYTCSVKPSFKITAMRDHLSYKSPLKSRIMDIHFYKFVPVIKDHLSYKTTFYGPAGGGEQS